ncbi:MAG TPA: cupredoxin domain-containing protein [Acidimicrobiia bacterium]|nr:cupredoxin domain-containing protein [Acidimicrobiia bacterium]
MRRLLVGVTVLAAALVPVALLAPGASATVATKAKPPIKLPGKVNVHGTATATGNTIEIDQHDDYFSPTFVKIPAKATSISVTIKNVGSTQHTFTVPAENIDLLLNPGESMNATIAIKGPGAIAFYCKFHQTLGMQGGFFDKKGAHLISSVASASSSGPVATSPTTATPPTTRKSSGSSGGYGY